jgi:hypothetical protein
MGSLAPDALALVGVAVDRRLAEPAERVDGLAGKLEQARGRVFFPFFIFLSFF